MKMPFTLRPSLAADADALLLFGGVAELLGLCIRLGGEAFPKVHRIDGGWVVRATSLPPPPLRSGEGESQERRFGGGALHDARSGGSSTEAVAARSATPYSSVSPSPLRGGGWGVGASPVGAIALRALSSHLLVPADSVLVPSLQPDEAETMTRKRGLVFLPGGAVLAYDPEKVLGPADLLAVKRRPGGGWRALPETLLSPPLLTIERDGLPEAVQALMRQAGQGIATESPAGGSWLGGALGWIGLGALGRMLDTRKQGAALEELLRNFRDGNTDAALRRALPLSGGEGRGGGWTESDHLPTHDFSGWATGGGGGGRGAWWHTDDEMRRRLEEAYRAAAAEAQRRGDFRRAAFIYGKLLGDWNEAARLLERAGLHDEAAVVWLHRIGDRAAAARAYEAAGRAEQALALYRELGQHVEAGDLLRKLGNEPAALAEYRIAAEKLAMADRFLPAADLFFRADLPAIAEEYLGRGWATRPGADSMACGERLAGLHSEKVTPAALLALLEEACDTFRQHRMPHPAGAFLNHVARLADKPRLATAKEALRDRVLLELAHQLRREQGRAGSAAAQALLPTLLGQSSVWSASQVADARAALAQPVAVAKSRIKHRDRIRLHEGLVTAFTSDPRNGTLFVAFGDGTVKAYSPERGLVREASLGAGPPITSMALEATFGTLHVLRQDARDELTRINRLLLGLLTLAPMPDLRLPIDGAFELCGAVAASGKTLLAARNDSDVFLHDGDWRGLTDANLDGVWESFLLRPLNGGQPRFIVFAPEDQAVVLSLDGDLTTLAFPRPWPNVRANMLDVPRLASILGGKGVLQVAGIRDPDRVMVGSVPLDGEGEATLRTLPLDRPALAVCWHYPGELAIVHRDGITWAKAGRTGCQAVGSTPADLEGAVAAASSPLTREVWIVFEDGELDRLPWPG